MTIREVEEQLGVTRANVRFYEKEGLLFPKRNPLNDYRDYSDEDIAVLEKIIFLRNLEIPVERIRQLSQGKAKLREVLEEQMTELAQQQEKAEGACLICRNLLAETDISLSNLKIPEHLAEHGKASLKDTLTDLWFFWDKLVVWGFMALQIIYTICVFPLLPEQIPASWQGITVTDYKGRGWIFSYLVLSLLCVSAARVILHRYLVGGLRCYMDELNAVLTVGGIGAGFCMEVYTILFLQGLLISMDTFLLFCGFGYLVLVSLIVLLYRKQKRGKRAN